MWLMCVEKGAAGNEEEKDVVLQREEVSFYKGSCEEVGTHCSPSFACPTVVQRRYEVRDEREPSRNREEE